MKLFIYIFIFSLCSFNSYASLYQCSAPDSAPMKLEEANKIEINYETKDAFWIKNARSKKFHSSKIKPFLIYYAVDSSEPFMQISINFEIAQLAINCMNSQAVNFVAIINSLYIKNNEIILCKDKKLSYININRYPELDKELKNKRTLISTGDHTTSDYGALKYLVRYKKISNEAFGNFPLAHPDFMYDLINLVLKEEVWSAVVELEANQHR